MLFTYFQKASLFICPAQSAYWAAFIAHGCSDAGRGNCWKTKRTCGKSPCNFSMSGCVALQCGHSRSLNSTIWMGAFGPPLLGPKAPCNLARVAAYGLGPKGSVWPTNAICATDE